MKIKAFMLATAVLLGLSTTGHARLVCSYQTLINDQDKYNSVGKSLIYLANDKISFAAILRQDRANFYRFGKVDGADTSDCMGHSTDGRARLERLVRQSDISQSMMRRIVNGNPVINVEIYRNFVYIYPEAR